MALPKRRARADLPLKEARAADSIMGTNNGSIASKRSVEMLYYPEPHFFRPFVKKPQRRAPLVNREYWFRMHAIAESVRQFMQEPSDKPKFVLNLGCGFDPLPFILLHADRPLCRNTTFVDVDYEKLMVNKRVAIEKTEIITRLLESVEFGTNESAVQVRSTEYIAVGCDLNNLEKLDHVLKTQVLPAECVVLFVAEVSLTYMDAQSANAVINWASKLSEDSEFCILEQFLPDGPNHPLASTVLKHYSKLGAPLHSAHKYPTLTDQERRFKDAGWRYANARSLWDLWSDDKFVNSSLRISLDAIESFDEWEEFALFESHYFLLHASMKQGPTGYTTSSAGHLTDKSAHFKIVTNCNPPAGQRRFGALIPGSDNVVGYHSGLGRQMRLPDTDLYVRSKDATAANLATPPREVSARMCHSITSLNDAGDCLLLGGRASPAAALQDCWVRKNNIWRASSAIPSPRFRHSATRVTLGSNGVLVYGGKRSDGTTLDTWLLWLDNSEGWEPLETQWQSASPKARFGACLGNINNTCGVLFGGIGADGTILEDFWTWRLQQRPDGSLYVHLKDQTEAIKNASTTLEYLARFGATITSTSWGLVIAGGVIPRRVLPLNYEFLLLDAEKLIPCIENDTPINTPILSKIGLDSAFSGSRPLLIGHASSAITPNEVLLLGGGTVCFPFGAIWTEGTCILTRADSPIENHWRLICGSVHPEPANKKPEKHNQKNYKTTTKVTSISRVRLQTPSQFQLVLDESQPVIFEGCDIGRCTEVWTKDYLVHAVGADRKVVVHEAESENMSFQDKNFRYRTKEFGAFMDEVQGRGRQYLRSLSSDQPTKLPTTLAVDFPNLNDDFRLPEALSHVAQNAHSSPLRISGPVTLWLHYDVMANVLCQIRGEKRLILFPPSDVQHLDIPAGGSSSNINIFRDRPDGSIASIPHTSPYEARLKTGDILFIPPLWLHTAAPTGDISVAVNVFFRNLSQGYATGRDVYGNRDLQAYEKARRDLERIGKSFVGLPPDMARFYLLRLAKELQEIAKG
ncbi:hypothetical protein BJY01DRAFT_232317 [Aspergillus pseudoustus]|uniref:tRNA wybutosine-synthesizing protein 4 n=1 Tax=Aspergillus pseudoustus TaxID=1810923 RepID=A0ABR4KLR1_9EURO